MGCWLDSSLGLSGHVREGVGGKDEWKYSTRCRE